MIEARVWFNHWFSTVYHIILRLKQKPGFVFTVIGSNAHDEVVYKRACDEWYVEPDGLGEEAYVEFALAFCKEHRIDVFAPRRQAIAVAKHAKRFEDAGVKLFLDTDVERIAMLENKARTYEFFAQRMPSCVPEYRLCHSLAEFKAGYEELSSKYKRLCYKRIIDEGAMTFRVITDDVFLPRALTEKPGFKVSYSQALAVLGTYDFGIPMLLMPYLDGVEVSVDCLKTAQGNLILPRFKSSKRYSEILFPDAVMKPTSDIMDILGFEYPYNVQFKKDTATGKYYLLEINARMSGGVPLTVAGTGINFPGIAFAKLFGIELPYVYEKDPAKVVHLETPVAF